ncbi:hypothetical protein IAU59_000285 [Kwoniella sp. CBS 9459]
MSMAKVEQPNERIRTRVAGQAGRKGKCEESRKKSGEGEEQMKAKIEASDEREKSKTPPAVSQATVMRIEGDIEQSSSSGEDEAGSDDDAPGQIQKDGRPMLSNIRLKRLDPAHIWRFFEGRRTPLTMLTSPAFDLLGGGPDLEECRRARGSFEAGGDAATTLLYRVERPRRWYFKDHQVYVPAYIRRDIVARRVVNLLKSLGAREDRLRLKDGSTKEQVEEEEEEADDTGSSLLRRLRRSQRHPDLFIEKACTLEGLICKSVDLIRERRMMKDLEGGETLQAGDEHILVGFDDDEAALREPPVGITSVTMTPRQFNVFVRHLIHQALRESRARAKLRRVARRKRKRDKSE